MTVNVDIKKKELFRDSLNTNFGPDITGMNLTSPFYKRRIIMKLPPSTKFIIYLLRIKGPMNRKQIIRETMMPDRTVGYALKLLLENNLIQKEDPYVVIEGSSRRRGKTRKRDRRITNYNLVSPILPFEIADA